MDPKIIGINLLEEDISMLFRMIQNVVDELLLKKAKIIYVVGHQRKRDSSKFEASITRKPIAYTATVLERYDRGL